MEYYIILILTILVFLSFIIGYILGKINHNAGVLNSQPVSFLKQQKNQPSQKQVDIDIDDKKVVVPIKTEDLEKKYHTLGETLNSTENITNSINKLKSMKG
jgi:hypothetical protein